ncbi:RNA 2'-phosphotransferase [Paenibacillus methanolicus]|uniref:Probable RNA 2'-phosphotransferase n=1 Tax=Paenibacillus methanolicus TaxID=582686 RepID=A0A5S5BMV4_9BACL|nr:RNA 2'-phosphotransferase [Paenibacillus methanolicus]TYP68337.1 putative RNA 2'-phosphotransferase [Paenibacillus methanolicus]
MKNAQERQRLSKMMTKMLRHAPDEFGLRLDPADGSCQADALLNALMRLPSWAGVTMEDIAEVVRACEKQRFELRDGRIRARYGHSYERVAYEAAPPPAILYHGTNRKALAQIKQDGLRAMGRQYVHLSEGKSFAELAGRRRGELVMLRVDTAQAAQAGVTFYRAGNEVWLADHVPADVLNEDGP